MRRTRGFTLVEAVITIAIMGVVLAPFSVLVVNVMRQNAYSQVQATAVSLAEGKMEDLTGTRFSLLVDAAATAFAVPFDNYTYQIVVDYVNSNDLDTAVVGPTDFKRVKVVINNSILGSLTLTSLVARDW